MNTHIDLLVGFCKLRQGIVYVVTTDYRGADTDPQHRTLAKFVHQLRDVPIRCIVNLSDCEGYVIKTQVDTVLL